MENPPSVRDLLCGSCQQPYLGNSGLLGMLHPLLTPTSRFFNVQLDGNVTFHFSERLVSWPGMQVLASLPHHLPTPAKDDHDTEHMCPAVYQLSSKLHGTNQVSISSYKKRKKKKKSSKMKFIEVPSAEMGKNIPFMLFTLKYLSFHPVLQFRS